MQNELKRRLPASFTARFPPHQDLAYTAIPMIGSLPLAERVLVTQEFANALRVIWGVLAGVAMAGLVSCVGMREIRMSEELDERFALEMGARSDAESSNGNLEMAVRTKMEAGDVEIQDGCKYVVEGPLYLAKISQ